MIFGINENEEQTRYNIELQELPNENDQNFNENESVSLPEASQSSNQSHADEQFGETNVQIHKPTCVINSQLEEYEEMKSGPSTALDDVKDIVQNSDNITEDDKEKREKGQENKSDQEDENEEEKCGSGTLLAFAENIDQNSSNTAEVDKEKKEKESTDLPILDEEAKSSGAVSPVNFNKSE